MLNWMDFDLTKTGVASPERIGDITQTALLVTETYVFFTLTCVVGFLAIVFGILSVVVAVKR
jgi:hypothetical protein